VIKVKHAGTLIAVKDIEKSKKFYKDILGLNIKQDFGDNLMLECGISFQTLNS
jgi:catechol 2,3-dioxygenase-like lactoylglutathione lyase family enzyme